MRQLFNGARDKRSQSTSITVAYPQLMREIWSHPANEQRPAVRDWLRKVANRGASIIDIGSGDAYYVADLLPRDYIAVEPNPLLQEQTRHAVEEVAADCTIHSNIAELLTSSAIEDSELVLMIHVLLYLGLEEASALLARIREAGKTVLLVHPHPQHSVSVEFEHSAGLERSSKLLRLKTDVLGTPHAQTQVKSHFVLPSDFSNADLAFLVSHHVLDGTLDDDILAAAEKFVRTHRAEWQAGPHLKLPQSQILEVYGPS